MLRAVRRVGGRRRPRACSWVAPCCRLIRTTGSVQFRIGYLDLSLNRYAMSTTAILRADHSGRLAQRTDAAIALDLLGSIRSIALLAIANGPSLRFS